jgi:peptidyl-prolyl cis-trans isomerase SurA
VNRSIRFLHPHSESLSLTFATSGNHNGFLNRRISNNEYRIAKCNPNFCGSIFNIRYSKLQNILAGILKPSRSQKSVKPLFFFLLLICLGSAPIAFAEGIDRLLAAVNGKVITEGDLKLARSLDAVIFSKNEASDSENRSLSRLIDLELLRQELKNFGMVKEDETEVASRLQALRETYAGTGGLAAFLQRFGLQESELVSYLRLESAILQFVNFRFRPFVNVTQEEINQYYQKKLASQLEKAGLELPPLTQVSTRIEEILREEKINEVLEQWMANIRRNSRIERFDDEASRIAEPESR